MPLNHLNTNQQIGRGISLKEVRVGRIQSNLGHTIWRDIFKLWPRGPFGLGPTIFFVGAHRPKAAPRTAHTRLFFNNVFSLYSLSIRILQVLRTQDLQNLCRHTVFSRFSIPLELIDRFSKFKRLFNLPMFQFQKQFLQYMFIVLFQRNVPFMPFINDLLLT